MTVCSTGIGRHGDDGQVVQSRNLANGPGGRHAVHHRHLHVHQDQIVGAVVHLFQSLGTVLSHVHHQAGLAQQLTGDLLVDLVVLDQQHAGATQAGRTVLDFQQRRATVAFLPAAAARGVGTQRFHGGVEQHGRADRFDQQIGDAD